jgi:putative PIG3 family NAD(P)H quinone oxidoreductase
VKATTVQADGSLVWQDAPAPEIAPGDVLVDVHATAVNRADLAQRAGHYPPPPGASEILGLEMAGVVSRLGAEVTDWQVGDKVCALLAGGGYAEQVAAPAEMLMSVPKGWGFSEAAAMPEVFLTAFLNLFMEAGLQAGETALIHGGASGVGTAAIQLAKTAGCRVVITAGSAEKVAFCRELDADLAVNYHAEDFAEAVRNFTEGKGVDVILDMVGADYLARNVAVAALEGRIVFIATLSGSKAELDIRQLMGKRLSLKGSTLRSRPLEEKIAIKEAFMKRFGDGLEQNRLKPVIDSVYDIREAAEAHVRMRRNENIGKLALRVRAA